MPGHRKFTRKKVLELRAWWARYQKIPTLKEVAEREGVNPRVIRDLCEERTYKRWQVDIEALAESARKMSFTGNIEDHT